MRQFRSVVLFCSIMVLGAFSLAEAQPAPTPAPAATVPVTAPTPAPAPVTSAPVVEAPAPAAQPVAAAPVAPAETAPVATEPATVSPKKDSKASILGGAALEIFIILLTISLPILMTPFVRLLMKKLKVTDIEMQNHVNELVGKAVVMGLNYAEEQAHKLRDNPVESAEKLNWAADKAVEYLKTSGIVDKGAEYIKTLIEAKLGETRENDKEKPAAPDA